jgi:hypothetical protein
MEVIDFNSKINGDILMEVFRTHHQMTEEQSYRLVDQINKLDMSQSDIAKISTCGNKSLGSGRLCLNFNLWIDNVSSNELITKEEMKLYLTKSVEFLVPEVYSNFNLLFEEKKKFEDLYMLELSAVFNSIAHAKFNRISSPRFFQNRYQLSGKKLSSNLYQDCYRDVCVVENNFPLTPFPKSDICVGEATCEGLVVSHCFNVLDVIDMLARGTNVNAVTNRLIPPSVIDKLNEKLSIEIKIYKYYLESIK